MMRYAFIITLMCSAFISKADTHADTVTYWVISYDKLKIVNGSLNAPLTSKQEISVKDGFVKNLTVAFVYDAVQPKTSSLTIKERNEVLRTIEQDPDMGPYFVVPVKELIGTHQTGVRYELDFYYTDDRGQKNLKLGTIIFIFK